MKTRFLFLILFLFSTVALQAQNSSTYQRIYLSGKDASSPVDWEFKVSEGRKAEEWSKIPVPSNWELHGFGTYNYGQDHSNEDREIGKEEGFYKYSFKVPNEWKDKSIKIVFAGSMTDTEVKVNGELAGPIHQGAFYEFKYDITDLLKYGGENLLEVKVAKHSENASVNRAERQADFWIFGGIYRPVYLEVLPQNHFSRIAIDAQASGKFKALLELNQPMESAEVKVKIIDGFTGKQVEEFSQSLGTRETLIEQDIENVISWNPESPKLYDAEFNLFVEGELVFSKTERIGFRTVELRENDGFYVNGTKVVFKGVNRHSFYPTSGRALSEVNHLEDIQLMKDMNMNAVRMSHYPPDERFLELTDSLGLFVVDEVTGWQDGYDTVVGPKLIRETVLKDENHPSVIIWAHGNEGGWDFANEKWFHHLDIQKRPIIYPWLNRNGVDTYHYPIYKAGVNRLANGQEVFMPTEMLHGLYDGGHGAGLNDFWQDYMQNPRAAGGFLWVFSDESVIRTDRSDSLDADGNHAPDGIVGPYREKEASYYTIKDIWSPVQIKPMIVNQKYNGKLILENQYLYTNLEGLTLNWKLIGIKDLHENIISTGSQLLKNTLPGESKQVQLDLPSDFSEAEVLEVVILDSAGEEVNTWSWPIPSSKEFAEREIENTSGEGTFPDIIERTEGDDLVYKIGDIEVYFNKSSFVLQQVVSEGRSYPFSGPLMMAENNPEIEQEKDSLGNQIIRLRYDTYPRFVKWTLFRDGRIKLETGAARGEGGAYVGINFAYPEETVKSIRWVGDGPYRVWQNRLKGPKFGLWEKDYNNTITGYNPNGKLEYPEFKGYHANLYAYQLSTSHGDFKIYTETPGLFFRLFTPESSPYSRNSIDPPFPPGDLSFLYKIPPIGTKFHPAELMGPSAMEPRNVGHSGDQNDPIVLWFDFE